MTLKEPFFAYKCVSRHVVPRWRVRLVIKFDEKFSLAVIRAEGTFAL